MKRTKLMLGVAALSAALLGTGYAAMTDTLTIGGQVSTANFCVQFEGEPVPVSDAAKDPTGYEMKETGAKLTDAHTITFTAGNMKAGVPLTYTTTVQNVSSIKAALQELNTELITGDKDLAGQIDLTVVLNKGTDQQMTFTGSPNGLITWDDRQIILEPNNETETNDEMTLEFTVEFDPTSSSSYEDTKDPVEFEISFDWTQTQAKEANAEN